jgi:hypothetical protein
MKMTRTVLVAVALCCFVLHDSNARDGNQLSRDCNGQNAFSDGACAGYIIGAKDALETRGVFCLPPGIEQGQAIDVVKLYLHDHPEKRHLPADELVEIALKEKFPCN